jgi:hypothetical protein
LARGAMGYSGTLQTKALGYHRGTRFQANKQRILSTALTLPGEPEGRVPELRRATEAGRGAANAPVRTGPPPSALHRYGRARDAVSERECWLRVRATGSFDRNKRDGFAVIS